MKGRTLCRRIALGLAAAALCATGAGAEIGLLDKDGLKLGFTFTGALGYVNTGETGFGSGAGFTLDRDTNVDWYEGYLKAGLNASYAIPDAGSLYGAWVMIGAATWEGQDAEGFNDRGPEHLQQDQLYVGWKSGNLLPALGEDAIDVSYGQQEFKLGDGFLIYDGNGSGDREGAYWLGPKNSFTRAGLLRVNTKPVRGDAFVLKSDPDFGNTELWGVNLELPTEAFGTFGVLYAKVTDVAESFYLADARDGMSIYDARWTGTFQERLFLSAEYVLERNSKPENDLKADAWYAEVGYTMAGLPWKPSLGYRYSFFSGDGDPEAGDNTTYDPLFYGFGRGWGTWLQGEIVGEYLLFNSNEKAQMVALRASPTESLGLGLLLFRFDLDRVPGGSTGKHFADEANLYADWQIDEHFFLGAVAGIARPGTAAKDAFGDDKDYKLFEMMASFTY